MTEQAFNEQYPNDEKPQREWRQNHPLIPEEDYERLLDLEAKRIDGHEYYGDEEEAYEILERYYPQEAQ